MKFQPCVLAFALFACGGDDSAQPDPSSGDASSVAGDVTWCQALGVLESSCQRCHTDPPQNAAPFSLMTYADTQAPYFTTDFATWERMQRAVETDFMPATFIELDPPVQPLTCEEKTTLLGWLDQGARLVGPENCTEADRTLVDCGATGAGGAAP
jgi:hypothetical protein